MALDLSLLLGLGLIVVSATAMSYLGKLLKQPPLLSYIVAGLIIGPIGLGALNLQFAGIPIGITNLEDMVILSELGIAFLLFSVGVESDFSKLFSIGKLILIGTILQVGIAAGLVYLLAQTLSLLSFNEALYVGAIIAFSSTTIVVKILTDKHELNTLHGRLMLGFLLMQDVLIVLTLPMLANPEAALSTIQMLTILGPAIGLFVLGFLLNKLIYPHIFRFAIKSHELLYLAAVSCCFVFISIAYLLNFSIAVGSFIAGLSLSTLPYNLEVYEKIRGLRDFFSTIFFVSLGMQISFQFLSFSIPTLLLILAAVFLLKPLLLFLITLFAGYGGRISLMVALGLAQVSEFSFIIAQNGLNLGFIQAPLYSIIILVIALSMALTPYFMQYSEGFYYFLDRFFRVFEPIKKSKHLHRKLYELEALPAELSNHIIVVGGGTVGKPLALALNESYHVIIVDHDSEVVASLIREGVSAVYGSADNHEVLEKINLSKARLLIATIPEVRSALFLLDYARLKNPKLTIFGRAHYYKEALALYEKGADFVVMPHVLGSNVFLQKVSQFLETGKMTQIASLKEEFMEFLKDKAKEEKKHFNF